MQKKIKSSTLYNWTIFLILTFGAFIRIFRINEILGFWYDQGRDALVIWDLIHSHKFFLIGPTTGLPGVFRGPWYYYLIAPFYWIGKGDPAYPAAFLALTTVLGIYIIFRIAQKRFGNLTAFIFTLISSISFYFLRSSRWLSNPTPMFLISALFLLGISKVLEKKEWGWYLIAGMSGMAMQFGSAAEVFYLPVAVIFALIYKKYFPKLSTIIISAIFFAIPFVPQALFDLRHNWIITKAIINNFSGGSNSKISWLSFLSQRLSLYYDIFASKIFSNNTIYVLPFLLVGVYGLLSNIKNIFKNEAPSTLRSGFLLPTLRRERNPSEMKSTSLTHELTLGVFAKGDKFFVVILITIFTPFIGLMFFRGNYGNLYDYYFTGYYFPMILLFSTLILPNCIFVITFPIPLCRSYHAPILSG